MKRYKLHLPEGLKDYLGIEATLKNKIQEQIKTLFASYHYGFIETPTFEYMDVWEEKDEDNQLTTLYKWVNREGEIVALRSDMTKAIARVVATRDAKKTFPVRYTYCTNTFRYPEKYQGKQHEFTQAGIEMIGCKNSMADAEVITMAVKALLAAGIEDFSIHVGSASFFKSLLDALGHTDDERKLIHRAIETKDAVALKQLLSGKESLEEGIYSLIKWTQRSGDRAFLSEVKESLSLPVLRESLEYLEALYDELTLLGVAQYILFDFSMLSYASYYTGIMFQGYTSGLGEPVVQGGRYDTLLEAFGKDLPAVGMALNIDLILQKVQEIPSKPIPVTLFAWEQGAGEIAIELANLYRADGLVVCYALTHNQEDAYGYGKAQGMDGMLYFYQTGEVALINLQEGTVEKVTIEALKGGL